MAFEVPPPLLLDLSRTDADRSVGTGRVWARTMLLSADSWGFVQLPDSARFVLLSPGPSGVAGLSGIIVSIGTPRAPVEGQAFSGVPVGIYPRLLSINGPSTITITNPDPENPAGFGFEVFTTDDAPEMRLWLPR